MAPCGTPNCSLLGPANDDLHFTVNKTYWNSCIMHALIKFIQFSVQIAVNCGLTDRFHTKAIPCSTLQCAAKGTNWTPGSWKSLMVVTMTFWLQFSSIFFCLGHNISLSWPIYMPPDGQLQLIDVFLWFILISLKYQLKTNFEQHTTLLDSYLHWEILPLDQSDINALLA